MSAAILRHIGARRIVITDINPYRLSLATATGVDFAVNVANTNLDDVIMNLGLVEGFQVGLEMSGSQAGVLQLLRAASHGGGIAVLGLPKGMWQSP